MSRVRQRRRHRRHKGKRTLKKSTRPLQVNVYAATRSLERMLFRGVPSKIDGWGFP
jgi:hypothetical protein